MAGPTTRANEPTLWFVPKILPWASLGAKLLNNELTVGVKSAFPRESKVKQNS